MQHLIDLFSGLDFLPPTLCSPRPRQGLHVILKAGYILGDAFQLRMVHSRR
jgi:hypothetical protein